MREFTRILEPVQSYRLNRPASFLFSRKGAKTRRMEELNEAKDLIMSPTATAFVAQASRLHLKNSRRDACATD
ncbi:MAG: hypothetical protein AABY74_04555 [Planctomycetota bacterium]